MICAPFARLRALLSDRVTCIRHADREKDRLASCRRGQAVLGHAVRYRQPSGAGAIGRASRRPPVTPRP